MMESGNIFRKLWYKEFISKNDIPLGLKNKTEFSKIKKRRNLYKALTKSVRDWMRETTFQATLG